MSASNLTHQGKLAYSERRYNDAVRLLSEAQALPKVQPDILLAILDLRCQAYAKLGKHDLALQDAKHMIHVGQRKKPEGYLRCSQVEKAFGNYVAAIRWLEHGAKHASPHRHVFEDQITRIQTLITRCNADGRRQDPIAAVPLEVIQHILSYLDYREVVSLIGVSKSWKRLVSSMKPLITTVDFTGARRKVSSQACNAAFRRLCREPQRVILTSLSSSATKVVEAWLAKPSHLETLRTLHLVGTDIRLNTSHLKRNLRIESLHVGREQNLSFTAFLQLIECCQTIKDAAFDGIVQASLPSFQGGCQEHVQHLLIRNESRTAIPPVLDFSIYPSLRSLTLIGVEFPTTLLDLSNHHNLIKLHLRLPRVPSLMLKLPTALEDLGIIDEVINPVVWVQFDKSLGLSNLRTLSLTQSSILSMMDSLQASEAPRLNKITLRNLPNLSVAEICVRAMSVFQTAKQVYFMSEHLSDHDVENFAGLFPMVESLTIESAPRVTGVFLSDLVSKPNCRLKEVVLKDCDRISSDTCQWLNSKGISSRLVSSVADVKSGQRVRGDW